MKTKKEVAQEAIIVEIVSWTFIVGLIYVTARALFLS